MEETLFRQYFWSQTKQNVSLAITSLEVLYSDLDNIEEIGEEELAALRKSLCFLRQAYGAFPTKKIKKDS